VPVSTFEDRCAPTDAVRPRGHVAVILAASNCDILLAQEAGLVVR
jgi:hypothetical protein